VAHRSRHQEEREGRTRRQEVRSPLREAHIHHQEVNHQEVNHQEVNHQEVRSRHLVEPQAEDTRGVGRRPEARPEGHKRAAWDQGHREGGRSQAHRGCQAEDPNHRREEDQQGDRSHHPEEDRRGDRSRHPEEDRRGDRSRHPEGDRRGDRSRRPEEDRQEVRSRREEDRRGDRSLRHLAERPEVAPNPREVRPHRVDSRRRQTCSRSLPTWARSPQRLIAHARLPAPSDPPKLALPLGPAAGESQGVARGLAAKRTRPKREALWKLPWPKTGDQEAALPLCTA
jgi:hypothetical protein